jgi:acetyl esterase/lipase
MQKHIYSWFVFLICASTIFGAEPVNKRNIPYLPDGKNANSLDIYSIKEAKDRPVMIWIHGGGWRIGDKARVEEKPTFFLNQGFVFVSINYRMLPETDITGMATDCAKAVKWIFDNIHTYGGNKEKLFLIGHSAGAHLAALISTDEKYLEQSTLKLTNLKGTILVDGAAYNVPKQIELVAARGTQDIYLNAFTKDPAKQQAASPTTHVDKDKGIPPFLILCCASRKDSPLQGNELAKLLQLAGTNATVYLAENKSHASINRELGIPADLPTKQIEQFLSRLK